MHLMNDSGIWPSSCMRYTSNLMENFCNTLCDQLIVGSMY